MLQPLEKPAAPKSNKEVRVYHSCVLALQNGRWRIFVGDELFLKSVGELTAQKAQVDRGQLFSLFEAHLTEIGMQKISGVSEIFMFHGWFTYDYANRELEERIRAELEKYGLTVL